MTYAVKAIYLTLQGEGAQSGMPAVFLRFSGCNLWSGREEDRASAICKFCDTDFQSTDGPNGGVYKNAAELADAVEKVWGPGEDERCVVCTGGEPLLQLDKALIKAFHDRDFAIAVETNGTCELPDGLDWVCVSPKPGPELKVTTGDELKLIFPQDGIDPTYYEDLDFDYFFLQPMDCAEKEQNTKLAVEYCLNNPKWRLSIQTHKVLGLD